MVAVTAIVPSLINVERGKPVAGDGDLARLLQAVKDSDDKDLPADNECLATALAWSLDDVADCLKEAKDRSLIWGSRSGQRPAPWFTELELTVQGKRFLTEHPTA